MADVSRTSVNGLVVLGMLLLALPARAQDRAEITFWESVRDSRYPAALQSYLDAYPNGKFAALARIRIKALGTSTQPVGSNLMQLPAPQSPQAPPPAVQIPRVQPTNGQLSSVQTPHAQSPVAALPFIQWRRFIDPYEGSFTMDAPVGWQASGGIARRNALQYAFWLSSFAPDGNTIIAFGDANSQSFILPTPMLATAGIREGSLYNGGGGTSYRVSRYLPGLTYAELYANRHLPGFCSDIQLTDRRERPDAARFIGALVSGSTTAGEVRYTCRKNGMTLQAYAFAATSFIPGSPMWYPSGLYAFLTPKPLTSVVEQMVAHMLRSIAASPAWLAGQSQTAMAVSRIATETGHQMSDAIMHAWEAKGATIDRIMEERSRETLGIDIYADPATGEKYTVANAHNFYWRNPRGTVIGTETDTPPGPDFARLQRVPPGGS